MRLLKQVAIFFAGSVILIAIGTLPDIISNLTSDASSYRITKPHRWLVNVEVDSIAGHDTIYFYTKAIIQADSIKELTLPNNEILKSLKNHFLLDDQDIIYAGNNDGTEYIIELVKE